MKRLSMKRLFSLMLCILMVAALLPMNTMAVDAVVPQEQGSSSAGGTETQGSSSDSSSTGASTSDTSTGESSTPETTVPETTVPETSVPETSVPETTVPETTVPETAVPETAAPETAAPETVTICTVTFVINGVTDSNLTQQVEAGGKASKPNTTPSPSEEDAANGSVFLYWTAKANKEYDFSTPLNGDLVLYAKFSKPKTAEAAADESTDGTTDATTDGTTGKTADGTTDETTAKSTGDSLGLSEDGLSTSMMSVDGGFLPPNTPLVTYTFIVGTNTVDTKTVGNGEMLYEPETPAAEAGTKFVGWYTDDNTLFTGFGEQTVTEAGAVRLTAHFETAYYAFFHNQYGSIIETRTPDSSNQVSTAGILSLQLASSEALVGWSKTSGGTEDVGSSVTVNGKNENLYPIIKQVVWISFNSNGGTYIAPTYINPNTELTQDFITDYVASQNNNSSTITKPGYTFTGWSGFAFGTVPTGEVTLSANWTTQNVTYTVVYLVENADNTDYSYYSYSTVTAAAGSTITNVDHPSINGFTYLSQDLEGNNIVNGDGTTVITVKYSRNQYQVLFYKITGSSGGNTTYAVDTSKTISAKHGAYIGNLWPTDSTGARLTYKVAQNSSVMQTGLEIMPIGGDDFWALNLSGSHIYKLYYYTETLNMSDPYDKAYNGRHYVLNHTDAIKTDSLVSTHDDHYSIYGFTYTNNIAYHYDNSRGFDIASFVNYEISFYYNRNIWTLQFYNYNAVDTTHTDTAVLYQRDISGRNYEPSHPASLPSNYTFAGWYTTPACITGSEYSFANKTMPNANVQLYAKWAPPTFTGVAHSLAYGTEGGGTVNLGTIPYGGTVSDTALAAAQAAAEAENPSTTDEFGGWFLYKNGSLTLFNPSMRIYEDITLYPKWISTLTYSLTYDLGVGASGTAPVDSNAYGTGAQAQVKAYDSSVVTPPEGKRFYGWRSSADNNLYYPNSAITMTANTTLTAQWSAAAVFVDITYDGNGGTLPGNVTTIVASVPNNTDHIIQECSFSYTGKVFTGWATERNGGGTRYSVGQKVLVGGSVPTAPSVLYAQWRDQTFSVTVTANPAAGVSAQTGAGSYVYNTNATVTWTLTNGYEITSVTDNDSIVPASSYTGNSYTINGLLADHAIIINTQLTLFHLTYNGNGGTYNSSGSYSLTKTMNTSVTVDANEFTKDGSYFLGWSTVEGDTTPNANYAPGKSITMPASDLTLYAIWADKTPITLTANSVTLVYNGAAQSASGISTGVVGLTAEGATAGVTKTNAGVYPTSFNNQTGLVLKYGDLNVTERYSVSWVNGTLTITPAVLTVQAQDQEIKYPAGKPAAADLGYSLVSGNVAGETPAYNGNLGYSEA
ncbi:MAG: InlB B-repeat-containing protein, partial [Eubacteriales bacterium]|nr:InlB B-repeat-containing protein [Eubacteriales bacterium]